VGCALSLLHGAREAGRELEVLILEPKQFGQHYNQCAGVVIRDHVARTLAQWDEGFPEALVQRQIAAYVLHAGEREIALAAPDGEDGSCAMRRVEFDGYLLARAAATGATVLPDRLTDLEFTDDGVAVYTEGRTHHADAVVGAFGLDGGATRVFAARAGYHPPPCLETLVTKMHPHGQAHIEGLLDDRIHAFLPRLRRLEFGALIPKGNHVSVTIAGVGLRLSDMAAFLRLPEVSRLLPADGAPQDVFRGAFPLGLARGFHGERYLVAGDAAGLVRPFKGGGINAALMTGGLAGACLLEHGPGPAAAHAFLAGCLDLRRDVWYGRRLRGLVGWLSAGPGMAALLGLAQRDPEFQHLLYDCVSGRVGYRQALAHHASLPLLLRAAVSLALPPRRRIASR